MVDSPNGKGGRDRRTRRRGLGCSRRDSRPRESRSGFWGEPLPRTPDWPAAAFFTRPRRQVHADPLRPSAGPRGRAPPSPSPRLFCVKSADASAAIASASPPRPPNPGGGPPKRAGPRASFSPRLRPGKNRHRLLLHRRRPPLPGPRRTMAGAGFSWRQPRNAASPKRSGPCSPRPAGRSGSRPPKTGCFGPNWLTTPRSISSAPPAPLPNGELARDPALREILLKAIAEATAAARRAGHPPLHSDLARRILLGCRRTRFQRNSMLQDLAAGRRTEAGMILGPILAAGSPAPILRTLLRVIERLERRPSGGSRR